MDKGQRFEYDIQKRAKAGTSATFRAAAALYLVYLAYKLIRSSLDGSSPVPPVIGWLAGLIFIAVAVVFSVYTWKRYRADLEAARLPTGEDREDELEDPKDEL